VLVIGNVSSPLRSKDARQPGWAEPPDLLLLLGESYIRGTWDMSLPAILLRNLPGFR
jgi:hypothetical protein